jgi:DNA-binding NarL/FixJ family response regulator
MVITVLLADDHGVLRDGVRRLLEVNTDIRVTATVRNATEALAQAVALRPDVALVDISMPGLSGIELTRAMRSAAPETAVLILSMFSSSDLVREALRAGASGYLLKESAGEEVVKAVRAVKAGRRYLGERVTNLLIDSAVREHKPTAAALTARERDVLRLVVDGKSNAEAAAVLGLSIRSVETYRLRLMQKLGLSDVPALVKYAIRNGIIIID